MNAEEGRIGGCQGKNPSPFRAFYSYIVRDDMGDDRPRVRAPVSLIMKETAKHMLKPLLPLLGLVLVVTAASGRARAAESSQRPPPRINACFTGKLAVIQSTREACQRIRAYVEPIWKSRALLLDDTAALKTNLSDYAVVTYGTLPGNLWVKQHLTNWPVVIAGDAITTERRWEGSRLRVIACWRSPANPARPWVLYAAQNEQDVVGINGVFQIGR